MIALTLMTPKSETIRARLNTVDEHLSSENSHDLAGIMATFGSQATYEDRAWDEQYHDHAGVRSYYENLVRGVPDIHIEVLRKHITEENIILEAIISGTHLGTWRGLPPTGRRIRFPLCAVYSFDADNRLAGERIYYDRASVLHQLGVFHEPDSWSGWLTAPILHPLTFCKVTAQTLFGAVRRKS